MRSLPFTYRAVHGAPRDLLEVRVAGECGGSWFLRRGLAWNLVEGSTEEATAGIEIPQAIAWRIFTKGIPQDEAEIQCRIWGDPQLAIPVLGSLAIVG